MRVIDKVWRHCEDKGTRGRTVTLKVKFADFEQITRSRTLAASIGSRDELETVSTELLKTILPDGKGRQAAWSFDFRILDCSDRTLRTDSLCSLVEV
jgi:nucleotidyltransferase/DNA polymerase involved in DNA repair